MFYLKNVYSNIFETHTDVLESDILVVGGRQRIVQFGEKMGHTTSKEEVCAVVCNQTTLYILKLENVCK
jgi:hypothetical protein